MPNRNFAAVDIGTNSFHLIIIKVEADNSLTILDREKEVIRLGSQKGNELNFITEDEIERGTNILKKFKKLSEFYEAELHAVATSAVREADNRREFLDNVFINTGINIEVIDGKKEAEYIYAGIRKALPFNKKLFCLDIGGGSSEFILGKHDEIIFGESVKIGAVRLSKNFFPDFILSDERIDNCKNYIEKLIKDNPKINYSANYNIAVGASGTILAAAGMINFKKSGIKEKSLNGYIFTKDELEQLIKEIFLKRTPEERTKIEGMEYKRADIIPAGLLILQKSFELFNIKKMMISEYALREGVVLSMLKKFKKEFTVSPS